MQQAGDYKQKKSKVSNEKVNEEDFINQLPDEITASIVSKLSVIEAARTSIISRKWRYLWTFFNGTLEFNGSHVMKDMEKDIEKASGRNLQMAMEIMYDAERQTYINWVNELLNSLQSSTLQGLRFWFQVGNEFDKDKVVQFAIQKKVKKLELFFGHSSEYVLPLNLFKSANFNSLCTMKLKSINLTREIIEYLLCFCPLLETLTLVRTGVPENLTVYSGPSQKLKCLELLSCCELKNLELVAENLVSFRYLGPELDIEFKRVPRLVEATIGGSYVEFIRESFLSQMKVLKLDISQSLTEMNHWLNVKLPDLRNLKELELGVCVEDDGVTLRTCALLLKASPSLWKLKIKMVNMSPIFKPERKFTKESEYSVKELEMVGFCGAACEAEIVLHILENSDQLKKIIVDTRLPDKPRLRHIWNGPRIWDIEKNRKYARDLQDKIPTWVQYIYI